MACGGGRGMCERSSIRRVCILHIRNSTHTLRFVPHAQNMRTECGTSKRGCVLCDCVATPSGTHHVQDVRCPAAIRSLDCLPSCFGGVLPERIRAQCIRSTYRNTCVYYIASHTVVGSPPMHIYTRTQHFMPDALSSSTDQRDGDGRSICFCCGCVCEYLRKHHYAYMNTFFIERTHIAGANSERIAYSMRSYRT